ncbi:MAG TPA: hypothetical protein VFX96_02320 [Pyrinomonadaceae bacterium]|nr:hypothetical protein [Pyrinomonadaceae bacterium]
MTIDVLTEEAFTRNVNTKFQIALDESRRVELALVEVVSYRPNPGDRAGMERFSAFFEGPPEPFLGQGTFTFEHEHLGSFLLFITPVQKTDEGFRYEAVINRMSAEG